MLDSLNKSLKKMQDSFMLSAESVKKSAISVNDELLKLQKSNISKISNQSDLNKTIQLIEKLSIQNDFKLNFLKDFSTYTSLKK